VVRFNMHIGVLPRGGNGPTKGLRCFPRRTGGKQVMAV